MGVCLIAGTLSIITVYAYRDDTANKAIANVERQRRLEKQNKEWLEAHPPKPPEPREPSEPVDWHKVIASPHKKVHINKANYLVMMMNRELKKNGRD